MDLTSSPFLMRNINKQTLIFDFNNVASEHSDDEDESSEVLIGNLFTLFFCKLNKLKKGSIENWAKNSFFKTLIKI